MAEPEDRRGRTARHPGEQLLDVGDLEPPGQHAELLAAVRGQPPGEDAQVPQQAVEDGALRLRQGLPGRDVVPVFQSIRLHLDADKRSYSGSTHTDLRVANATNVAAARPA